MDGVRSWFDYMSSRTDLIVDGLTQTLMYVVVVTLAAAITAVVVGVLTMRHTFAKELALAISSVFLTIPSLALFTIFIPIVGLGFTPSFIALWNDSVLLSFKDAKAYHKWSSSPSASLGDASWRKDLENIVAVREVESDDEFY